VNGLDSYPGNLHPGGITVKHEVCTGNPPRNLPVLPDHRELRKKNRENHFAGGLHDKTQRRRSFLTIAEYFSLTEKSMEAISVTS